MPPSLLATAIPEVPPAVADRTADAIAGTVIDTAANERHAAIAAAVPGWTLGAGVVVERLQAPVLAAAFALAERLHRGQRRASGAPYLSHCVAVAELVADMGLDTVAVAAALLHDVLEDTPATVPDIIAALGPDAGPEAARVVQALTKLKSLPSVPATERQVENYRRLLVSMAHDARVLLIKIADRVHNMRTIAALAPEKRRRIAQETRLLYAPLAHRVGLAHMKAELEDAAFAVLEPEAAAALAVTVTAGHAARHASVVALALPLRAALLTNGIAGADVQGRPKHLWSIHKKMIVRQKPYDEIYDLLAVRVLVDTVPDCYHALGVVHDAWTPVPDRIKDYIASPKVNGYQSLHTTVLGPGGHLYEVQIRTRAMHRTAEYGLAAHWRYKQTAPGTMAASTRDLDHSLAWFREVLETPLTAEHPDELLELLGLDLVQHHIFVLTPKGDAVQLPLGSTPLDLAFAIHSDVGLHCHGALVNGRIVSLTRPLANADRVEILTSPHARPSRDWLPWVRTSKARHRIRAALKAVSHAMTREQGRTMLDTECRRRRVPRCDDATLLPLVDTFRVADVPHLLAAVGDGSVTVSAVLRAAGVEGANELSRALPEAPVVAPDRPTPSGTGLLVGGLTGLLIRTARCCDPVPGDAAVGFVTRGRGVSVHRDGCPSLRQALAATPERTITLDWGSVGVSPRGGERYPVTVHVRGAERRGFAADVTSAVASTGYSLRHLEFRVDGGTAIGALSLDVPSRSALESILDVLKRVRGVRHAGRVQESIGPPHD